MTTRNLCAPSSVAEMARVGAGRAERKINRYRQLMHANHIIPDKIPSAGQR